MGKIAFVFAGQGTQAAGMGRDLYENVPEARAVFDRLDSIRPGTSVQCFTASKEELSVTENTQPCVFAVEMAAVAALERNAIRPDVVAGFSLGEISALTYAGLFPLEECFRFILERGTAMNKATGMKNGRMAAILKLQAEEIELICATQPQVWAVNYNSPEQTVISGIEESVRAVMDECQRRGGKGILLNVNGGFHSPLMEEASQLIDGWLKDKEFRTPLYPVYSNVTGEVVEKGMLRQRISEHVKSPVLWRQTIESMRRDGVELFVEIGPGKVLSGLVRKIFPEAVVTNVEDMESLGRTLEIVKNYQSCLNPEAII